MDLITDLPGNIIGLPNTITNILDSLKTAFMYIGIVIGVFVGVKVTSLALTLYNDISPARKAAAGKTQLAIRIFIVLLVWGGLAYLVYRLFFTPSEEAARSTCPLGQERVLGCNQGECVMTACGAGMHFDKTQCDCACDDALLVSENGVCHERCGPGQSWDAAIGLCVCKNGGTRCGDTCCPAGRCTQTSDGKSLCCDAGQACGGICCDAGMMCVGGQCRIPCGLGVTCDPRETCLIIGGGGLDEAKLRDTFQVPEERLGAAEDGKYYVCQRPAACRQGETLAVPASVQGFYPCGSRLSGDLATGGLRYCTSSKQVVDGLSEAEREVARDCFQKTIADCRQATQCRVVDMHAAANTEEVKRRNADLRLAGDQDQGFYCQPGTDESMFKAKYIQLAEACGPDACMTFAPPNTVSASYDRSTRSCAFVQSCALQKVLSALETTRVAGAAQLDPIDIDALTLPCSNAVCPVSADGGCDTSRGVVYQNLCVKVDGTTVVGSSCYRCYPNQTAPESQAPKGTECTVGGAQQACFTSRPEKQCPGQFTSNLAATQVGRRALGYIEGSPEDNVRSLIRTKNRDNVYLINNSDMSFLVGVASTRPGVRAGIEGLNGVTVINRHSLHTPLFNCFTDSVSGTDSEVTVTLREAGSAPNPCVITFVFTHRNHLAEAGSRTLRASVSIANGPRFPIWASVAGLNGSRRGLLDSENPLGGMVLVSIDQFKPSRPNWGDWYFARTQISTDTAQLGWEDGQPELLE